MKFFLTLAVVSAFLCGAARAGDAVPATAFFPVMPFDQETDMPPQWVPIAANHVVEEIHPNIARAIVVLPDETRDANGAVATMAALAGTMNNAVMIVSPQFLLPSDLVRFSDYLPEKGKAFATWKIGAWTQGDDSVPVPGRKSISSFTVMDLVLMYLADKTRFPDLTEIVVAGFGAGANFTQRYAAFGLGTQALAKQGVDVRFLVAGAPSYFYPTATRLLGGSKGMGRPDSAACPGYNDYPYGADKLNVYARRAGGNSAKTDYALRFVTYISAQAPDSLPENNCAAMAQGQSVFARAQNFRLYMQALYSDVVVKTQSFALARENSNDAVALFGSGCGMALLFGDGMCPAALGGIVQ